MEKLAGVIAKEKEYALRVLNGEDINEVLKGAEAFRAGVEALIVQYEIAKQSQKKQEDYVEEVSVPETTRENPVLVATEIHQIKGDIQNLFEHKKVEWDNEEHKAGVTIYNTFMDIGKGLSEGLHEGFDPKVQQYVEEIRSGKPESYVLSGAPKSIVEAVEKKLAEESAKDQSAENLEPSRENIDELKTSLESLSKDYYFLTHQTYKDFAQKINTEGFLFQGGGLNTTTLAQGVEGITLSLKNMEAGESHRNSDSMVIFAIPKKEYSEYASDRRFGPDEFADMLMDTKLDDTQKSGSLRIPHEYILGVYEKSKGFLPNKK